MTQARVFVAQLTNHRLFGENEKVNLRAMAGRRLNESQQAFDIFSGLWWPLREKSAGAPRRETSWLIAKLYAAFPVAYCEGEANWAPVVLGRSAPRDPFGKKRYCRRFDSLLMTQLSGLEPHLQWALAVVSKSFRLKTCPGLDWGQMLDDLSIWDRGRYHQRKEDVRSIWADKFFDAVEHNNRR